MAQNIELNIDLGQINEQNKKIKTLNSSLNDTLQNVANINITVNQTNKTFDTTAQTLKKLNEENKKLASSVIIINQAMNLLNGAFLNFGKYFVSGMLNNKKFLLQFTIQLSRSFDVATKSINEMLASVKSLVEAFVKFAQGGSKLAFLFSLSKFNKKASETFSTLNEEVSKFREIGEKPLNKNGLFGVLSDGLSGSAKNASDVEQLSKSYKILDGAIVTATISALGFKFLPQQITGPIVQLGEKLIGTSKLFNSFYQNMKEGAGIFSSITKSSSIFDKGLIGLGKNLSFVGVGVYGLGTILRETDSVILSTTGILLQFVGVLTGGIGIAIVGAVQKVGQLVYKMGTELVNANLKAFESFKDLEKQTFVFERTVTNFGKVFGSQIGTLESYNALINDISKSTGVSTTALRSATTELVSAGSQFGFNKDQLEQLLKISVDYAEVAHVDVLQATIDLVSALNGNSQSVLKYGVKLSEASIQHKIFEKGLNLNFSAMSENEKIQQRFNSLLEQYVPVAGLASEATKTLAGQDKILKGNLEQIITSYGKGVSVVENFQIVNFLLNKTLGVLGTEVFQVAGLFGALIGRASQLTGAFLSVATTLAIAIKGFKTVDDVTKTGFFDTLINTKIPLVSATFKELIASSGATRVELNSLKGIIITLGSIIKTQFTQYLVTLSGVQASSLTFATFMKGFFTNAVIVAGKAVLFLAGAMKAFLLNPIVIKITLIVGAFYALYKALVKIEEITGIFSLLWESFSSIFEGTSPIVDILTQSFSGLGMLIKEVLVRAFGVFIFIVNEAISVMLALATVGSKVLNALGLGSNKFTSDMESALKKSRDLSKGLVDNSFNFEKLGKSAERGVASVNKSIGHIDFEKLGKLKDSLKDVGITELDKLKRERDERIKLLNESFSTELRNTQEYNDLKLKIEKDYNDKSAEIQKKEMDDKQKSQEEIKKRNLQTLKDAISLQQTIQQQLQAGFNSPLLGLFGRLTGTPTKADLADMGLSGKQQQDFLDKVSKNQKIGAVAGVTNSILGGAQGAKSLISGAGALGADMLLPGAGQVVGPLLDALQQGPEAVKGMVREFAKALPELITALIEAVPVLIEEIIVQIPNIINALIEKLPRIITAIIEGIPRIIGALSASMPTVALTFSTALVKEAPNIAKAIIKSIGNIPGNIGRSFGVKFATGGSATVKRVPTGSLGDRFRADLTSGELVVDRSTAFKLKDFLDNQQNEAITGQQSSSGPSLMDAIFNQPIIVKIGEREVARAVRNQVKTGFVI